MSGIGLSREHRDLQATVQALVGRHGEDLVAMQRMLHESGLLALHVPEAAGGSGFGLLETAIVVEESAAVAGGARVLPTVLATAALARGGAEQRLAAAVDTPTSAGFAFASEVLARSDDGGLRLSGQVEHVLGGIGAELVVLPVLADGVRRWCVVPAALGTVEVSAAHDQERPLARLLFDDVHVAHADLLALDDAEVRRIAATLIAAECSGLAAWATRTAADHAQNRTQFGRAIGEFQGVKHRVARMLTTAERIRACAWDAARALDGPSAPQAEIAAAVAGGFAPGAAVEVLGACIDTLGGIGFTLEHRVGHLLRRAQVLRQLLGPRSVWRREAAELSRSGVRRELGLEHEPTTGAELAAELDAIAALPDVQQPSALARGGFAAPYLKAPWGRSADAATQLAIAEELARRSLTVPEIAVGGWVVPGLISHGTEDQQALIAPTLSGDVSWCQLFSEPEAGSDLASLRTRAIREGDGWRISGQKVWTSGADAAQYGVLLARTATDGSKHAGLSMFLLDMAAPGITIRPLPELTGHARFSEVFLDDVLVAPSALLGTEGEGWHLARATLASERVAMSSADALGPGEQRLLELVDADEAVAMDRLGELVIDAYCLALLGLRQTIRAVAGDGPGPEASLAKVLRGEHIQRVRDTALSWSGPSALADAGVEGSDAWWALHSRCYTIAGGTTDIQLNVIGERLLGLPRTREPERSEQTASSR